MIEKDLHNFIKNALIEDVGDGDHTSLGSIPKEATSKAHLLVKDKGIIYKFFEVFLCHTVKIINIAKNTKNEDCITHYRKDVRKVFD